MSKMTLADLRAFREQKRAELDRRDPDNKDIQVVVAMGTCGIAAGAKATFGAILDELDKRKIGSAVVRQVGCMGLCHSEPNVEISVPGMPTVIYGKVNEDVARQIVRQHIMDKSLIDEFICDRPSPDIVS